MFELSKLTQSTERFQKYVEPQLYDSGLFDPNNSYVVVCEGDDDDLKSKLDRYAGIDMCTIDTNKQVVQGIASRVQTGPCYRTFTIRAITDNDSLSTEFKKRAEAIKNGDMYPTWTIQAYISENPDNDSQLICTVGVVRTVELFNYLMAQFDGENIVSWGDFYNMLQTRYSIKEVEIKTAFTGGAVFLACDWDKLIASGVHVDILQGIFDK